MATTLDLAAAAEAITRPDQSARDEVRARLDRRGEELGRLGELAIWLAGARPEPLGRVRLLLVGAHDVPDAATADLADAAGIGLRMVAAADDGPDVDGSAADDGLGTGAAIVDDEVDQGADLLLVASDRPASDVGASALVGLLASTDAAAVTSRGTRIDDAGWMTRAAAVRDTMRAARPVLADQVDLLARAGSRQAAVAAGVLLQAAVRRTPVVLDGVHCLAGALVAQRVAFRAVDWWQAASAGPEPAWAPALDRLGLRPLLDLALRREDGTGALLAACLARAASAHLAAVSDRAR